MKKIALFLDNSKIASVDCSNILQGNPGIGGTECMIITIATLLSMRDNGISVDLYVLKKGIFPSELNVCVVDTFKEAVERVDTVYDYLIFKHDVAHIHDKSLENLKSDLKLIPWCHVFVCYWELDYYANNPFVSNIINVGREMNDLYRDHKAFKKSNYIYNCLHIPDEIAFEPYEKRQNIVTYIGCIKPFKGFHLLAKAWPKVVKEIPDAQLYVIGSGNLYDKTIKMGRYNIAEEMYENVFMHYLSQEGRVLPSVHFMGVLGEEKNKILAKTKVGVPNPSGITETFGISAVEMQLMGARIATMRCPGHIDTVKNGSLYHNADELAQYIIELLNSNHTDYTAALEYFKKNFSYDSIVERWETLILKGTLSNEKITNPGYRLKFLKELLRRLKNVFPCFYKLPPIERILLFVEKRILRVDFRYIDSDFKFK